MRILIVGVGSIGCRHAKNFSALAEVAIVDRDVTKCLAVAKTLGVKGFGSNLAAALQWNPTGAIIATDPASHLEIAEIVTKSGVSVLIEKPLSNSYNAARVFLEEVPKDIKVFVGCNMRYHVGVLAIRKYLSEIGRPLLARASFCSFLPEQRLGTDLRKSYVAQHAGGGIMFDSTHELDYLRWLVGPIIAIGGYSSSLGNFGLTTDDFSLLLLEHESGLHTEVHHDFLRHRKTRSCEIIGTDGTISWLSDGKAPELCCVSFFGPRGVYEDVISKKVVDHNAAFVKMAEDFIGALAGEASHLQTGWEGLEMLELISQCSKSPFPLWSVEHEHGSH